MLLTDTGEKKDNTLVSHTFNWFIWNAVIKYVCTYNMTESCGIQKAKLLYMNVMDATLIPVLFIPISSLDNKPCPLIATAS